MPGPEVGWLLVIGCLLLGENQKEVIQDLDSNRDF